MMSAASRPPRSSASDRLTISPNDYYVSGHEIEEKSKFVEVLLILALFESINIDLSVSSRIINRLSGYRLVTKNEE